LSICASLQLIDLQNDILVIYHSEPLDNVYFYKCLYGLIISFQASILKKVLEYLWNLSYHI